MSYTSAAGAAAGTVPVKCACPTCHCVVTADKGVLRDGRLYCSRTCAYDCTQTTCVCIHGHCGDKK